MCHFHTLRNYYQNNLKVSMTKQSKHKLHIRMYSSVWAGGQLSPAAGAGPQPQPVWRGHGGAADRAAQAPHQGRPGEAGQGQGGPDTARVQGYNRASNEPSRRLKFYNHGVGLLLV